MGAAQVLGRRASLIGRAKTLAGPVVTCVQNRLRPDHLLAERSWQELYALVIVLAEAADPAMVRDIAQAPADDGRPDPSSRPRMLRAAHAQAQACREADRAVPARLALLECEYYRWRRQERREAGEGRDDAAA